MKKTIYIVSVAALLLMAVLVVAGRLGIGGVRALVVQSGSMTPSIGKNSIVVTAPTNSYSVGDVITFKQLGRDEVLVTHRIQSVAEDEFVTKGDANEEADGELVPARDVVGEVVFSIPLIGAVISFAQTTPGFISLIVVPAVVIVYSEILSLKKHISHRLKKRKTRREWSTYL